MLLGECLALDKRFFYSNARVKIYSHTGLVWDPKTLFLDFRLVDLAPAGQCVEYVISGTTLDPKFEKKLYGCTFGG